MDGHFSHQHQTGRSRGIVSCWQFGSRHSVREIAFAAPICAQLSALTCPALLSIQDSGESAMLKVQLDDPLNLTRQRCWSDESRVGQSPLFQRRGMK